MKDVKLLRNSSLTEQPIIFKGQRYSLKGKEAEYFPKDIADEFLRLRGDSVKIEDDAPETYGSTLDQTFGVQTTWLANVTGDPEINKIKVTKEQYKENGRIRYRTFEEDNVNATPHTLVRKMAKGQEEYTDDQGVPASKNLGSITLKIPPFRRVQWPSHIATWFRNRDGSSGAPGAVRKSKPRGPNEPDMGWDLNDMRRYYEMLTGKKADGKTEEQVAKECTPKNPGKGNKAVIDPIQYQARVREEKKELMQLLFFKLVDPKAPDFTKSEFEAFKTGKEPPPKEDLEAILDSPGAVYVDESLAEI